MKKLAGNKKEAATWLKPAGEYNSSVTDTSIAASYTRSVEGMFQSVNGKNLVEKMKGNKKEVATWLKPAGEHRSAVTDTSIAASYTRSVEEMIQSVNGKYGLKKWQARKKKPLLASTQPGSMAPP
ncbi:hypothetical protein [Negativicoccus succinicivorans]|uniref:hypothetical protein n=1 Tax=Negativicoccus succinicivorans TaxID=620903 RepID=UPI0028D5D32F|nr:hypothetical protein [Negativicoccus succinicivorans]